MKTDSFPKKPGLPTVEQLLQQAIAQHQAGRLQDAERLYRAILQAYPKHPDANHNLGVLANQLGKSAAGLPHFKAALEANLNQGQYWLSYIDGLIRTGQIDGARQVLEQGRQRGLSGEAVEALTGRLNEHAGNEPSAQEIDALVTLFNAGRHTEAAVLARELTVRFPLNGFGWKALGALLKQMGRSNDALLSMQKAAALAPNDAEAHYNFGLILKDLGRLDEAEVSFRRALQINPNFAKAHSNLGYTLHELARLDEAEASYLRMIQIEPDDAEGHYNLAVTLHEMGRLDEAEVSFRRTLQIKPDDVKAHSNLGYTLHELGRLDEAEASYRQALQIKPDDVEVHRNLALTLLTLGDMTTGWQEYEWRWATTQMIKARRDFTQPHWRGEAAEGRTLLIHAEQGFGDTLQFCRYAQLAAACGMHVILEVPSPLVRLLRSLAGVDLVVGAGDELPPFDLHCPMLSMPLALKSTLVTIPSTASYLHADQAQVDAWHTRLATLPKKGCRIGLVWAGNSRPHLPHAAAIDRRRSVAPERLAPFVNLSGFHFFSLQKGGVAAPEDFPVTDFMDEMEDFADTAALIANLDLVISVDTAVAHLAAALGKPVWVLDRFDSCWRWLRDRQDSPWYPSLRLFRQPKAGDWQSVIEKVVEELSCLRGNADAGWKSGATW